MSAKDQFCFTIHEQQAGSRLDTFIAEHVGGCSRSLAHDLILEGIIRVNHLEKKPSYRLKTADQVTGMIPPAEPVTYAPEPIPLNILFEDRDLIVLNKPPGLVVHPAPGHPNGTLVNGLLHHCPNLEGIGGQQRPGIVHRLDKDTSGTLVIAKTALAHAHLSHQFKARNTKKIYLALVYGELKTDTGVITFPIGRHPTERKKMSIRSRNGREAETHWKIRQRLDGISLLEIRLKTGRTHQIRVHCAAIHHPVVGDCLYGWKRPIRHYPPDVMRLLLKVPRQMLHAWKLGFTHPRTGQSLIFESPVPEDMTCLINLLNTGVNI